MGIQKIFEDINKKYSKLKKDRNQLKQQFTAYKTAVAEQLKQFSVGLNNIAKSFNTMSKGVDERFKLVEKKPCMSIKTVLTEKELKSIINHLALST